MTNIISIVPMPTNAADMLALRQNKREPNILDQIEQGVLALLDKPAFNALIKATNNTDSVSGSTLFDDVRAAEMLQAAAVELKLSLVAEAKLTRVAKGMKTVLRRYHMSRAQRVVVTTLAAE